MFEEVPEEDVFENTEAEVAVKVKAWRDQLRLKKESKEQELGKRLGKETLEEDLKGASFEEATRKRRFSKESEK